MYSTVSSSLSNNTKTIRSSCYSSLRILESFYAVCHANTRTMSPIFIVILWHFIPDNIICDRYNIANMLYTIHTWQIYKPLSHLHTTYFLFNLYDRRITHIVNYFIFFLYTTFKCPQQQQQTVIHQRTFGGILFRLYWTCDGSQEEPPPSLNATDNKSIRNGDTPLSNTFNSFNNV